MKSSYPLITILIIGKNTSNQLQNLLHSIDLQNTTIKDKVDILYIDDCSSDNSVDTFNSFQGKFVKQYIVNRSCLGRSESRNIGIRNAQGTYILFLNSNVEIVGTNLIESYYKAISSGVCAGFGKVRYTCPNINFEKYLNHPKRGSNSFENMAHLSPTICLFSNCIIKKSIINNVSGFNNDLREYGGEEADLAFRIKKNNLTELVHISQSVVMRNNHPSAFSHARRLETFGKKNFHKLDFKLQKLIVPYKIIKKPKVIVYAIFFLLFVSRLSLKYPLILLGKRISFRYLLGFYFYCGIYSGLLNR